VQILRSPWCKTEEWNRTEVVSKGIVVTEARGNLLLPVNNLPDVYPLFSLVSLFSFVLQLMEEGDIANLFFFSPPSSSLIPQILYTRYNCVIYYCLSLFWVFTSVIRLLCHTTTRGIKELLMNVMTCILRTEVHSVIAVSSDA